MKYLVLGIGYDGQEYMAIHSKWRKHGIAIHLTGTIDEFARERIRQIEAKAIRKLCHPSRSKKLKYLYD